MRTKLCMGLLAFAGVLAVGACSRQHEAADAVSEQAAAETAPAAPMPAEERSRAGAAATVSTMDAGEAQAPDPQMQLQSSATTHVDSERTRFLVALNLGSTPASLDFAGAGEVALSTHADRDGDAIDGVVEIRGDEGVVVRQRE